MKEIYAALGQATATASAVGKRSKNEHHRYQYASSEHVIEEARDALSAHGLSLYCKSAHARPLGTSQAEREDGVVSTSTQWEAAMVYVLAHSSGESFEIESSTPIMPEKGRPLDKALATAKTYDLAYTLRSLLLLPRLDPREIAEEPVDQRRDTPGPAAHGPVPGGSDIERIIAGYVACQTDEQFTDLTRAAVAALKELPGDHPARVACRRAHEEAKNRLEKNK